MPGTCVRCHNSVIYAEETNALGKVWHTRCYLCANCNKSLHNISVKDRDGDTFCEQCYAKLFKSEGCVQVIITAGSIDQSALVNESSNIEISSDVKYRINDSDDHRNDSNLRINNSSDRHRPYLARSRYSSPTKFRSSSPCRPYKTAYQFKNFRCGDKICGRCNKTVYLTENVYGAGAERSWHQACFRCNKCEKRLDSLFVQTYKGEIYCVACSNNYHFAKKKF